MREIEGGSYNDRSISTTARKAAYTMFNLRRRKNRFGDWIFQVWPSDLPANAPEPSWQLGDGLADCLQAPVMAAVLGGAFHPLPHDDAVEEAQISKEEWDRFSFFNPEDET
ncbi:MAG: hypothetical protein K2X55_22820 [Burkholderiaceae bacterium]|nr:hypothetical protein [Burkholderiaceae bacterium]